MAAYVPPSGSGFTVGFANKTGMQTCAMGDTGSLVYARKEDGGVTSTNFIAGGGFANCTVDVTSVSDGDAGTINEGTFSGTLKNPSSAGSVIATNCAYRCTM